MSGAKNCPETPRQRMIGMMYLVLTAMLALNVSSEILNGFTMVDNSLHTTIESSQIRNDKLYSDFNYLYSQNQQKVKVWLDTAMIVKKQSDELYNYIEEFKRNIVKIADKEKADPNSRIIIGRDNLDASGEYAILKGNGKILKKKINDYSDFLVGLSRYSKEKQEMYKTMFATNSYKSLETKEVKSWEYAIFEMMPVAAVVTILTKYQSDIRSSEAEMVQYLKLRTDEKDQRVNKFEAMVIPNSKFVFKGEKYSAKIILAAIDTTKVPSINVNGSAIKVDKNGVGTYEFVAGGKLGPNKFSGSISLEGVAKPFAFTSDYVVNEPSVNISNMDLNVLYKGSDHNFTVTVPNVAPENVQIKVDGATYDNKGKGKYIIKATRDGNVTINVLAKIGEKMMSVGSEVFRVKKLPPPTTYIQDSKGDESMGGLMSLDQLRGASIIASYGPDALIQAKFRVTSFTMMVDGLAPANCGTKLDLNFLKKLSRGKTLIISNVVAVGPDGNPQNISSLVIRL